MAVRLFILFTLATLATLAAVSCEPTTDDKVRQKYCKDFQSDPPAPDSIDDYCKDERPNLPEVKDSDILRLNFAGRFLADTATYNNDRDNFNINTFDPLRNPDWNPLGTGEFRLVNCTVTQVCLAEGYCVQDDPVVGQPITGNDNTTSAKMVDLDPDGGATQLWGLEVGVKGFFKGDFVVRSSNHYRHEACEGSDCTTVDGDTRHAAVWLSTLEKVNWIVEGKNSLAKESNFMKQVISLKCNGKDKDQDWFKLYVKFSVYNMIVDPKSPDFPYGRVVGTIYAVGSAQPLPYGPYKRMLWGEDGGHVPFFVDDQKKRILLDFANSVNFDIKGNVVEPSDGRLHLVKYDDTLIQQGCDILKNGRNLGEIRHYGNDWFQMTGGMIEHSVTVTVIESIETQLAIIQQKTSTHCKAVLVERQDGLFVEAVSDRVWRVEPSHDRKYLKYLEFYSFKFGQSAPDIQIDLNPPPGELKAVLHFEPESGTSNKNGISTIAFRADDPGDRTEQQLDGQVYTYSVKACKNEASGAKCQDTAIVKDLAISFHVYSTASLPNGDEEVTWYEHVYPIFQQYANLFPVMKPIINLASYEDVNRKKKLLKLALCLPETDPNYMPVTRDLSQSKRAMILKWLNTLETPPKLQRSLKLQPSSTVNIKIEELKQNLQIALQLELATIPPYLSALFSIKDGYNKEVAALIKSVVVEEMKHMTLVSNILNAIGGAPVLNTPSVVSSYPAPLPGGANPGLVVTLAKCSLNQIRTVFQGIEKPNCEMADSEVVRQLRLLKKCLDNVLGCNLTHINEKCQETTTRPQTIGAIYIQLILCPMVSLHEADEQLFLTVDETKQINTQKWFGDNLLTEVKDIRTALAAIVHIISEGEGSDPCDPFDKEESELSHFFKFAEVVHGRKLIPTCPGDLSGQCYDKFFPCDDDMTCVDGKAQYDGGSKYVKTKGGEDNTCSKTQCDDGKTFSFAGRLVPFFEDGVWPTISNPHTDRYPPGSQVRKYSDRFNKIYTGLLNCLHEAFNGNPNMMNHCMGMMPSLTAWGKKLVRTPIDPDGDPEMGPNAAPTFEFYDLSD
ncbi:uncharacterized protein LOC144859641 isoform X2 [Branchiostoma floridae x Branchiostoma japonicum]